MRDTHMPKSCGDKSLSLLETVDERKWCFPQIVNDGFQDAMRQELSIAISVKSSKDSGRENA